MLSRYLVSQAKRIPVKDWCAITLSIGALCLSLWSIVLTHSQGRRAFRFQAAIELTNAVDRLMKISADYQKTLEEHRGDLTSPEMQTWSSLYSLQSATLARHTRELLLLNPESATALDFHEVAFALASGGHYQSAASVWTEGIARATESPELTACLRGRGNMYFVQGDLEKGRADYRSALNACKGDDDATLQEAGLTYQMWALDETRQGARMDGPQKVAEARLQFERIKSERLRSTCLDSLKNATVEVPVGPTFSAGKNAPIYRK